MKISNILGGIAAIFMAIAITSCAEDKVYDLGGIEVGKVNFKAFNLAIPDSIDSAISHISPDYYYSESRYLDFRIDARDPYYGGMNSDLVDVGVTLDRMAEIWSGGYNPIRIKFEPSSPAEKSATFTMPDGTTHTATVESPTFIWTPDSTMKNSTSEYIIAESNFYSNGTSYSNKGYIHVNFNPNVIYRNNQWYSYSWMNGQQIVFPTYLSYTAENLTVKFPYPSQSMNEGFIWSVISERMSASVPYINSSGYESTYNVTCTYNELFICGDNDIQFTSPYKDMQLYLSLPDGQSVTLNNENTSFIWHVSRELAEKLYYSSNARDHQIYGSMVYQNGEITYSAFGQINLLINPYLWYDEESKVFRYGE